ncbi:zinc finger BED domain-containing protein 5-like [Palaemon carinicauda]|uniref:zinc finger BED domain-containing protein 5-like n=1 Tax=Palaemon carinicauda TaxID=392227 RepID=UPI0035B57FE0
MVKKPYGSWRPCCDYRHLNLITTPDHYLLPNMQDLTNALHGAKYFTKMDLLKSYFQVPVFLEDNPKTATVTPFGSYTFAYSTFGLRNAGATFQQLMDSILETMLGKEAQEQISKVPLSNNTISRRISEMSTDINEEVVKQIKSKRKFALQVDESTDIAEKCQLVRFCKFICKDIVEQFMFCKELQTTTTGEDIFASVNSEALVAKKCGEELTEVLNQAVKMVNFIKSRPLKKRVFQKMCQEMGAVHISLILHTDIRWLSRGCVLNRVLELKEELKTFFQEERHDIFIKLLENSTWCLKLSYLADIFMKLNELNLSMQGRLEGIVTSVNKMKGFQRKLKSWKSAVQKDDVSNFPSLQQPCYKGLGTVKNLILNHLEQLIEAVDKYFPSLSTEKLDWIVSPFELADMAEELDFTAIERDEFLDMSADSTLKVKFEKSDVTLAAFWHGTLGEYPNLAKKAISLLLPFSTSYLCEQAFSAMATIKSKQRNRLLSPEDDMRVALSTIRPDIKMLLTGTSPGSTTHNLLDHLIPRTSPYFSGMS